MSKAPKKNEQVVVLTNAGGPGVLTTDAFQGKGIKLAELSDKGKEKLKSFLPPEASVENPIDLLADAQEDRYEMALAFLEKEEAGSILCVLTPQDQTPVEKIAEKIIHFRKKSKKVVAAIFIGGERIRKALHAFRLNSIHNFPYPEQAVNALDKYYQWSKIHRFVWNHSSNGVTQCRSTNSIILGYNVFVNCDQVNRITQLRNFAWLIIGIYRSRSVYLSGLRGRCLVRRNC